MTHPRVAPFARRQTDSHEEPHLPWVFSILTVSAPLMRQNGGPALGRLEVHTVGLAALLSKLSPRQTNGRLRHAEKYVTEFMKRCTKAQALSLPGTNPSPAVPALGSPRTEHPWAGGPVCKSVSCPRLGEPPYGFQALRG